MNDPVFLEAVTLGVMCVVLTVVFGAVVGLVAWAVVELRAMRLPRCKVCGERHHDRGNRVVGQP